MKRVSFRPFVYGLYDPVEPGHIRYVGMAFANAFRPHQHAKWANKPSTQPSHFKHWILKLQEEGRAYGVMILEELSETASYNFTGFVERCYIKSLREIGHLLTNVADGGNGGDLGPEVNLRISNTKKGKATTTGYRFTPEQRANISAGLKRIGFNHRQPKTEETRAKIRASRTGRKHSVETRKKMSQSAFAANARKKIGAQASLIQGEST